MAEAEHGFEEGDPVWVEDGEGKHHPGVFVGDNESSGWFGGGPSAYVVHPEAHNAEVVSIFRITPRDESRPLSGGDASGSHVHTVAAKGHALGLQPSSLPPALRKRAVGTD